MHPAIQSDAIQRRLGAESRSGDDQSTVILVGLAAAKSDESSLGIVIKYVHVRRALTRSFPRLVQNMRSSIELNTYPRGCVSACPGT